MWRGEYDKAFSQKLKKAMQLAPRVIAGSQLPPAESSPGKIQELVKQYTQFIHVLECAMKLLAFQKLCLCKFLLFSELVLKSSKIYCLCFMPFFSNF